MLDLAKWAAEEKTRRTAGRRKQIADTEAKVDAVVASIEVKAKELATKFGVNPRDKQKYSELLSLAAGTFGVGDKTEPPTLPGMGDDDETGQLGGSPKKEGG